MMRGYVLLTNKKKGLEKMKVKKIIALLLAMSLMFAFSACGSKEPELLIRRIPPSR